MNKRERFFKVLILFLLTITFLCSGNASALEKKKVAVLDFDAKNVSKTYADIAKDILEINLHNTGAFVVLERNQINLILQEQGLQISGCTDTTCAVQIGKFLSADLVVIGSLSKITTFTLSVKMVDIGKGSIILADTEKAETEDDIENSVKRLAMRFAEKIRGEKEKITP
ncbi:MAG: hypothetical protein JXN64_07800, partial [Spirochaetes bacterium]|nr:hypothetical protein [Spirochaetota bacterium]